MDDIIYILVTFFIIGGILMYQINKNKSSQTRHNSLVKYVNYFVIVTTVLSTIIYLPDYTVFLFGLIISIGLYELVRTFRKSGQQHLIFFIMALGIYFFLSFLFLKFSFLNKEYILYTYLIVIIFDAFSQLSGQLFGKRKLFPRISPKKTVEGLIGGIIFSIILVLIIRQQFSHQIEYIFITLLVIIISSLVGDYLASFYKRKYKIKDYSNLIPQHGGFLDRFDSFILAGAMSYLITLLF